MAAIESGRTAVFGPVAETPAAARRFLRLELEKLAVPEPPLEAAVLLANELVSNAVLHARTVMELRLFTADDLVRVEVHDGNTRRPTTAAAPIDATSGRGLLLVQAIADRWGVEGTRDGKVIWFELPIVRFA